MNILFICSRNKWRSRTAETIFKDSQDFNVKSAGTEPTARIRVSAKLIDWADIIFAMEKRHKQRLIENFRILANDKQIIVLDIPDEYQYMDSELIEIIKTSVSTYLDNVIKK
ncbi:MAG: protein tyrosine phosphatase [Candidatus Kapabacteria bacterium]|nr:protein tyrosine phosphatase [Candidatus Kapabacteria bacterium]